MVHGTLLTTFCEPLPPHIYALNHLVFGLGLLGCCLLCALLAKGFSIIDFQTISKVSGIVFFLARALDI